MKKSRSRDWVASCSRLAPTILGANTFSNRSHVWSPIRPSSSTPAAWMTPLSGIKSSPNRASNVLTSAWLPKSALATIASHPLSLIWFRKACVASSGVRRETNTTCPAPLSANHFPA